MGNDQSHLNGINIEEKSIEVSDFWTHYHAKIESADNTTNLSVLIGELFVAGPLWKTYTPLEKKSKNLMIYRHPCILKYISSWHKSSNFFLAIEDVVPLTHVLKSQNLLQISIGLHSILKAMCFLHEKANVSHNNICMASIYVTKCGSWKLGGMEYLCKYSELTPEYLKKSSNNRYDKAIDPNEEKNVQSCTRKEMIDIFAYGVLVNEVLKTKNETIASFMEFTDFCKNSLQNIDVNSRPKMSTLLEHSFFNHEFIIIHSFLIELPLKSDEEKTIFFQNLLLRLREFPEVTVATQFGSLLLSRLVLLNKTAQELLLPFILGPKSDLEDCNNLFTEETFKKFLAPKLLEIFCVRDAQIRLLLLNYFKSFVHTFNRDELQSCILPELLVGIKDTNDQLVAATLRTLADLIPILGAMTVIGGKRGKLFTDGRPVTQLGHRSRRNSKRAEATICISVADLPNNPIVETNQILMSLPERPRPDGEEGETSAEETEQGVEDADNWEDWEESVLSNVDRVGELNEEQYSDAEAAQLDIRRRTLPDITELDIKNQKSSGLEDEIDFFQDMEPVIESASKFLIEAKDESTDVSKLKLQFDEEGNEDGWGEEEW